MSFALPCLNDVIVAYLVFRSKRFRFSGDYFWLMLSCGEALASLVMQ